MMLTESTAKKESERDLKEDLAGNGRIPLDKLNLPSRA